MKHRQEPAVPMRSVLGCLTAGLAAMLVAGCAAAPDAITVDEPGTASRASAGPAAAVTDLKIVMDGGAGRPSTGTLTCPAADAATTAPGGTHPDPARACAALAKGAKTGLPPVGKGLMCTELYGGPQTAKITGTYLGQPVSSSLSRVNGCEIARWDALRGLLPAGGAGGAQ